MKKEIENIPIQDLTRELVDSDEEWYFTCYLLELMEYGVIRSADKNKAPMELSVPGAHTYTEILKTKTNIKSKHLFNKHDYTPDFNIEWSPEWDDVFFSRLNRGKQVNGHNIPFISASGTLNGSIIEVKGGFTKGDELQKTNMNRKWVFDKYFLFVQLIRVPDIFKKTFTPQKYIDDQVYTRINGKRNIKPGDSKLKYKPTLIKDYLDKIKLLNKK